MKIVRSKQAGVEMVWRVIHQWCHINEMIVRLRAHVSMNHAIGLVIHVAKLKTTGCNAYRDIELFRLGKLGVKLMIELNKIVEDSLGLMMIVANVVGPGVHHNLQRFDAFEQAVKIVIDFGYSTATESFIASVILLKV